jgi:hypothetical protein
MCRNGLTWRGKARRPNKIGKGLPVGLGGSILDRRGVPATLRPDLVFSSFQSLESALETIPLGAQNIFV